jgi:hypothetical protein
MYPIGVLHSAELDFENVWFVRIMLHSHSSYRSIVSFYLIIWPDQRRTSLMTEANVTRYHKWIAGNLMVIKAR